MKKLVSRIFSTVPAATPAAVVDPDEAEARKARLIAQRQAEGVPVLQACR